MKRILLGTLVGAGLLLVQVVAAPLVLAGNPCYHGFEVPELTVGAGSDIKAMPCAFDPAVTVVDVGETVTFRNGPEVAHLVTGANAGWGDRDIQLAPNATVAYTFDAPGIYPYACTLHPGMSGAIVVGDGGPALAAAMTGAGTGAAAPAAPGAAKPAVGEPEAATADEPAGAAGSGFPVVAAIGLGALLAAGAVALLATSRRSRRPEAVTPEALPH